MAGEAGKKISLKGLLDSLVDEDGLKTEVTVTLTRRTLGMASAYAIGTAAISAVVVMAVVSAFNKAKPG